MAADKNPKFKLLLTLLKFEKDESAWTSINISIDVTLRIFTHLTHSLPRPAGYRANWKIPGTLTSSELSVDISLLQRSIENPVTPNGRPASELIRKKLKPHRKRAEDEEDGELRRRRGRREIVTYKSAEYIVDSDDEEGDEEFFKKEREIREMMVCRDAGKEGVSGGVGSAKDEESELLHRYLC